MGVAGRSSGVQAEHVRAIEHIVTGDLDDRALTEVARLRHLAVRDHVVHGAATVVEAPAIDLFAGETGCPEVRADEITAEHVASGLLLHGALVVRGLVGEEDVTRLLEVADHEKRSPLPPADATGQPVPDAAPMACSVRGLQRLVDAYRRAGMGPLMTDYLGEAPVLLSERLLLARRVVGRGLLWHQDAAFFGGTYRAVNSWLALSRCGRGRSATGLSVVPERFDHVFGSEHAGSTGLNYGNAMTPENKATPTLEPGDAVFIDEMTMHRTALPRKDPAERAWAVTWFFAPSRFPAERHPLYFG